MTKPIALSTSLGEVMAPQTLVTALTVTPLGEVTLDAGALHGRSAMEGRFTFVPTRAQVGEPTQPWWIVWLAVELDAWNQLLRYKGLSVCELAINPERWTGFKSLAEHVNRMSEAMRGVVNVTRLPPHERMAVKAQLFAIGKEQWDHSSDAFKRALEI